MVRRTQLEHIPAGYQLYITTWENDGDDYKTQIFSGLTKEDVRFYLELGKKFNSHNDRFAPGWGNNGRSTKELCALFNALLLKHPNVSPTIREKWSIEYDDDYSGDVEDANEAVWMNIIDLLGSPSEWYSSEFENFCRVFESYKVFYLPDEIKEVTDEFEKRIK